MYKYLLIDFANYTVDTFNDLDEVVECIKIEYPPEYISETPEYIRVVEVLHEVDNTGIGSVYFTELELNNVRITTEFTIDPVEE